MRESDSQRTKRFFTNFVPPTKCRAYQNTTTTTEEEIKKRSYTPFQTRELVKVKKKVPTGLNSWKDISLFFLIFFFHFATCIQLEIQSMFRHAVMHNK